MMQKTKINHGATIRNLLCAAEMIEYQQHEYYHWYLGETHLDTVYVIRTIFHPQIQQVIHSHSQYHYKGLLY